MYTAFPNHNNKGKGHTMIVSAPTNTSRAVEGVPDLNNMGERVQHLYKFKHFYDQMDFNPEQRLAITKSIIELTDPSESCDLVEGRSRCRSRFDATVTMFYDVDRHRPTTHSRSLYVSTSMNGVELKRAMLDPGSSINIISLSTLDVVDVSRDKIIRQPIEMSSF